MRKLEIQDNNSLRANVFKELEQAILNGNFAPGDSLIEQRLSAELGVSRTPVREALRQLELEGLVKTVPNKGAVVIGVSTKDILDIYSIRMKIESLAARWAATNITDEELDALREVVELQTFYVSRSDAMQVWNLDTRFHEIIFEACRSRPLRHTLSGFHHYIQKARELSFKTAGRARLSVEEHRAILEAIAAHDPDEAERLTELHISMARENVAGNLGEVKG